MDDQSKNAYIYLITFVFQKMNFENTKTWMPFIAKYIIYYGIIRFLQRIIGLTINSVKLKCLPNISKIVEENQKYIIVIVCAAVISLMFYWKQAVEIDKFIYFYTAHFIMNFPKMRNSLIEMNYGEGIASSFVEGYLVHTIPSGENYAGLDYNIDLYEARNQVKFPVRKLFIVVTKTLYCPTDLKEFNRRHCPDVPYLEACKSLRKIVKDVAGVKNRTYRNSVYKIHRPGGRSASPVYLVTQFSSPLNTLYRVLRNKDLYDGCMLTSMHVPKLGHVNVPEIVNDFCTMLERTINKSLEIGDKCIIVYYDNTNPKNNLADLLLEKIKDLNPNFDYDS